jgi:amino-acid N-acetyltransferase
MSPRPIDAASPEWQMFVATLGEAGLVTDDLIESGARFFALGDGAAFAGYERFSAVALLRSVVAPPASRGRGLGAAVVGEILDELRGEGVEEVWLLTTSAKAFFARQGFTVADRAAAPAPIAACRQFATLCPSSAELMCRKPV